MKTVSAPTKYILRDNDVVLSSLDKEYVLRLRDMDDEEKPREKLMRHGPAMLATTDLLAIILNAGTRKEEVLSMATRVLREYGEKNVVHQKNPVALSSDMNIPIVKACQIIACFELGRRFFRAPSGTTVVRSSKQAFEYLSDMRNLPKEHLRGLYLNSHYRVIHDEVISIGSLTANIIHPREVFRPAIEYSAAAVIVAHNHPSDVSKPNDKDIEITKQLIEAGNILGIDLLDHLIITKNKFVSILDEYIDKSANK